MNKKISSDLADELHESQVGDTCEGCTVIEQGEWIDLGKSQSMETIFECEGKYYELDMGRSGSAFTDYEYASSWQDEFDCPEVRKEEVKVIQWKRV